MIVNRENLEILHTNYNALYMKGMTERQERTMWPRVAMEAPSGTSEEKYGWIGNFPSLREWAGERVVHGMEQHDYTIKNKDFELTISVPMNDIADDQYGTYGSRFTAMGQAVVAHPDQLVFSLLKDAFGGDGGVAYDGQYLIDTDHPVIQADGTMGTVSNSGGGGTPWFLIEKGTMYKPIIFQSRKAADTIVRRDQARDEPVFTHNEAVYGVHARHNVGFGWWQTIYGSKQDLTAANYKAARAAMMAFTGDGGRPLGIMPDCLVVPPLLEQEGRQIVMAERNADGSTNVWNETAELLVVPWLA